MLNFFLYIVFGRLGNRWVFVGVLLFYWFCVDLELIDLILVRSIG